MRDQIVLAVERSGAILLGAIEDTRAEVFGPNVSKYSCYPREFTGILTAFPVALEHVRICTTSSVDDECQRICTSIWVGSEAERTYFTPIDTFPWDFGGASFL